MHNIHVSKLFILLLTVLTAIIGTAQNYCMRFYGHGTGDIDRIKIPIDAPEKPVDVANDFTIEFEMKASLSDNPLGSSAVQGNNDDWTLGHIIVDRDIFGSGDYGDYGISLVAGKVAFGVNNGSQSFTLIGATNVADNAWHHIAVTRNSSTGAMRIFVDGNSDAFAATGPTGNISYRNGRTTTYSNDPYLVLGAEKHDYNPLLYPSYNGYLDELRISNVIRYTSNFTPPNDPFVTDTNTVGLYHFDEGSGTSLVDVSGYTGGPSNGIVNFGGSGTPGPVWVLKSSVTTLKPKDNTQNTFTFYPNPFGQFLYSSLSSTQEYSVFMYDLHGKQIPIQQNANVVHVPSNLPTGMYYICVAQKGDIIFRQILLHE